MNRIDRLTAILIQLQSRPLVKAQDIADRFSISLRTVYRDVHALQESGVPIHGEAGTGYRMMEGYKLPPVMFSQDEASALLTASKLMQTLTDVPSSRHYTSALDKIRAVLRLTEKAHIAELDEHVAVITHRAMVHEKPAELHLSKILQAIANSKIIEIDHTTIERNERLTRRVEPVGIYYHGSHWYLVSYCHLRRDYRDFRTDKINTLTVTTDDSTQTHPPLQKFLDRITQHKELKKIVLQVRQEIMKYFGEQKYYNGFVKEEFKGDLVEMTFLTSSLAGFARWFMVFGDHAIIIEPLELREHVVRLAGKLMEKNSRKT